MVQICKSKCTYIYIYIYLCVHTVFNTWHETDVSLILKIIICKTQAMRKAQPISPRDRRYRHFLRIFIGSSLPKAALSHTAGLNRWTTHAFEAQVLVSPWKNWKPNIELKPNILCEKVVVVHIKIIKNTSYTHMFDVNIDARWCEKTTGLNAGFKCVTYLTLLS